MEPQETPRTDWFARLVLAYREYSRLLDELQALGLGRDQANRYLVRPDNNPVLGHAYFTRNEAKRAAALGRLRALRTEAHRLAHADRPGDSRGAA